MSYYRQTQIADARYMGQDFLKLARKTADKPARQDYLEFARNFFVLAAAFALEGYELRLCLKILDKCVYTRKS